MNWHDTYKPSLTDRVMDDGRLFALSLSIGIFLFVAVILGLVFGGGVVFGERSCAATGRHLNVPSVYDRWQSTCYLTVDGHKVPEGKYIVNQPADAAR